MKAITRRQFLQTMAGSACLAAAAAHAPVRAWAEEEKSGEGMPSFLQAPEAIDPEMISETIEADVVVVGGGLSGICTAVSAYENGLSVAVVEKNKTARGTGLDFGCINSSLAKEYGIPEYTQEDIYRMARRWVSESGGKVRPDFVLQFLNNSGAAIDWITEKAKAWGCTPVIAAYSSKSDTYSNMLGTVEFHNGPAWSFEMEQFGSRDVIDAMTDELAQGGYPVSFNTRALQLTKEGDRVTGVICEKEDGSLVRYEAKKGVVLAAGDFARDEEMMSYYSHWNYEAMDDSGLFNCSLGTGDGQKMGLWAGGQMDLEQPMMFLPFTYPYFYLHVNKNGERFMNEDSNSVGMSVGQMNQPNGIAYSIWDSKWKEEIPASLEFGGGMDWDQDFRVMGDPWSEEAEQATHEYNLGTGNLVICDTIEELAEETGLPYEKLQATIDRYNELVAQGWDEDFGKRPELLTSISEPPYYALRMTTGLCVSVGGLNVDIHHAVLDAEGLPIPGLYAVGNNATDLHLGTEYIEGVVAGNSLGRCVTYGKLLGEYLSR